MQDGDPEFAFVNQLPGMSLLVDYDQRLMGCSEYTAKLFGFKNKEAAWGVSLYDLPCKVAEYAHIFEGQNRDVLAKQNTQKILDVHPFAQDEIKAFLVSKKPYKTVTNKEFTLIVGTEVKRSTLLQISLKIIEPDRAFRSQQFKHNRNYILTKNLNDYRLSARELECLFYLVRGKTSADIAKLTRLSKRTIESYIDNIKIKMDCLNKADVIERAIETNLIDFVPENLLQGDSEHLSLEIESIEEKVG